MFRKEYHPHPLHYIGVAIFMAAGTRLLIIEEWWILGCGLWTLAILLGIWIPLSDLLYKVMESLASYKEYWHEVNVFTKQMLHSSNPEMRDLLAKHFGFQIPDKPGRMVVVDDSQVDAGYMSGEMHQLPVSDAVMQSIADRILLGSPFSEGEIVKALRLTTGPKFRELSKLFRDKGYTRPNSVKNTRMGFSFTKKGAQEVLYRYASETTLEHLGMKLEDPRPISKGHALP